MRGLKWPLARFMVPGAVMGLGSLALAIGTLIPARAPNALRMLVWVVVLIVATMGPLRGLAVHVDTLLWGERFPDVVPLERRLELIFMTPRVYVPS
jgi:low temperature requirement protein LtrA